MLRFISFGSGSSGNCYYLYTETESLLIDAGIGPRLLKKYFIEYGLPLADIKNVLLTHDHADHVKSIGNVCEKTGAIVYTTREVHIGIDKSYCIRKKVPADNRRYVEKGKTFSIGSFTITPFGVPHDSADNVGYKIECDGITFCIITDAGEITDEMKPYISDANYLVIEANHDVEMLKAGHYPEHLKRRILSNIGHLSNEACALALCENATPKLRHVWLCHLSDENNHPELARTTIANILREHGIIADTDFQLDTLRRKLPSEINVLE